MSLYFITGNKNKFEEIKATLGDVELLDIDLPEIQDFDAHNIIKEKLHEAFRHHDGEFIVEDTSLYLNCLNGLPGPFIKWFLKTMGNDGLVNMVEKMGDSRAEARTIIGYARNKDTIKFFEGSISGTIVRLRGETIFGWDPIFLPDGHDKTFAEMTKDEKNALSMRMLAATKLKQYREQT